MKAEGTASHKVGVLVQKNLRMFMIAFLSTVQVFFIKIYHFLTK